MKRFLCMFLLFAWPAFAQGLSGNSGLTSNGVFGVVIIPTVVTIANLPACNSATQSGSASISNGVASPTYNATVSTTGSTYNSVFCNGTNWVYR